MADDLVGIAGPFFGVAETLSDLMDRFWTSGLVVDNAGLVPRPLLGAHYLTETLSELMDRFWTSVHLVVDNAGASPCLSPCAHVISATFIALVSGLW